MTQSAAVRAVLDRLVEAWNDGDATAYADCFTEDADYVTFFGLNTPGRAAIEAGHRALFEGPLKGSKLTGTGEPPKIRFVRDDVAIAVAGGGSSLDGEPDPERASTVTYVLVREPDAWRVASFQNTRRTPVPGRPA
ncbi:SgcJ/EcaC family oxidoreductase [Actinosynnema sp. NPDC053489]|uniref:SgcJ/EcaC family oxidoreductase n=1 Tax=Actinosynnema sp. NPDC053489 TaxID=3363916 RepID=UPI0037CBF19C